MPQSKLPIIDHKKRDHYENGGSQITKRNICPMSLFQEREALKIFGQQDGTSYSDKGLQVHEVNELIFPHVIEHYENPGDAAAEFPEKVFTDYEEEILDAAQVACMNILSCMGDKVTTCGWALEQKHILDHELQLGGTADCEWAYIAKDKTRHAHIWDYKDGVQPVDAKKTRQLELYAASLQHEIMEKGMPPFDFIHTHIFQPNSLDPSTYYTEKTFTKEDIEKAIPDFKQIARTSLRLNGPDAMYYQAGEHCRWCKGKEICGHFHQWQTENATHVLKLHDENKLPAPVDLAELADPEEIVKTLTDQQLYNFFIHIDYIQDCCKKVKERIKAMHLKGTPLEGTRCVAGQGRRSWRKDYSDNIERDIGLELKRHGVEKPWKKKLPGIGEAEKMLQKAGHTKDQAYDILSTLTDSSSKTINIVIDREDDPRPAIEFYNEETAIAALKEADSSKKPKKKRKK